MSDKNPLVQRATAALAKAFIGGSLLLPYNLRVRFFGWLTSFVAAPLSGWKRSVRQNLTNVMPELPQAEVDNVIASAQDWGTNLIDTPHIGAITRVGGCLFQRRGRRVRKGRAESVGVAVQVFVCSRF